MKLKRHFVEKPWGVDCLPPPFAGAADGRIGEVWFTGADDAPLLLKYLFTSDRLSVQVHPNDDQARTRGLGSGKEECWYVVAAEEGATLGLGLKNASNPETLRAAALDGSIEDLLDWKPVSAGDFFFVPAGTVHAIGGGLSLVEFQQNADVTYRLYDYGRPRELHLDDGIAVATAAPYAMDNARHVDPREPAVLASGRHFSLVQAVGGKAPANALADRRRWVIPLDCRVRAGTDEAGPGDCLLLEAGGPVDLGNGRVLVGAEGPI